MVLCRTNKALMCILYVIMFEVLRFIVVIVLYCSRLCVAICLGLLAVSFFSHFSNIFSLRVSLCTPLVSQISIIKLSL